MEGIVSADDLSKDELYEVSRVWLTQNMKSADGQILLDDDDKSKIVSTGNVLLEKYAGTSIVRSLNYKLSMFFKEGRMKYVFENIVISADNSHTALDDYMSERIGKKKKKFQLEIDEVLAKLISKYENQLKSGKNSEFENW